MWLLVNHNLIEHISGIILLVLLFVYLSSRIKNILSSRINITELNYLKYQRDYDSLLRGKSLLEEENSIFKKELENTIALYDITKEICKSLDEDAVFAAFKQQLKRYLDFEHIRFIKSDTCPSSDGDCIVLPLIIERSPVGYLVAEGISEIDKEKFLILAHQFILGIKRAILYQRVQELAITDFLTGVFSRRYFLERFNEEIERSKKFNYSLACLMIDIDRFKDHNDHFGHLVGDAILKDISKVIKEKIRQVDIIGRYGGEEFCVVLSETKMQEVSFAAERIRQAVEQKIIKAYDEDLKVTISIGVAVFPENAKDMQALIDNADQALYKAKKAGRNKVCFYKD